MNVSPSEFQEQKEKIQQLHSDLLKTKNMLRTVNLNALPDKGKLLQERYASLERQYNNEAQKLNIMNISKGTIYYLYTLFFPSIINIKPFVNFRGSPCTTYCLTNNDLDGHSSGSSSSTTSNIWQKRLFA